MAYPQNQPSYVTGQPGGQGAITGDPFRQPEYEWSTGLCNCCEDMSQCMLKECKLNEHYSEMLFLSFIGCYAYFCWPCFLGTLAHKINESSVSCCFVPNVLSVYRMKIRSTLKIRVSFIFDNKPFLIPDDSIQIGWCM